MSELPHHGRVPRLEIRPPLATDFAGIGVVFHEAVHGLAKADYTPEQLHAWAPALLGAEHWRRRTAALEMRVCLVEGRLAGFIGFSVAGYIDLLFTRPEFARRGVARALLLEAERWLWEVDVRRTTTHASLTARPFFEAMGYSCILSQTVECRGVELRNFEMAKRLEVPHPHALPGTAEVSLFDLLGAWVAAGAHGFTLCTGEAPVVHSAKGAELLADPVATHESLGWLLQQLLDSRHRAEFRTSGTVSFFYDWPGGGRFVGGAKVGGDKLRAELRRLAR